MSKLMIVLSFCVAVFSLSTTAHAGSAQFLLDARTGEVLASENPDTLNHPASLTKMMTIYMALDAIRAGKLSWDSPVPFSKYAAARPPTKLRVKAGDKITVKEAVLSLIIVSANDSAAALGEKLGGSEEAFAAMMTRKARALGMLNTTFFNASGLPHDQQFTTARDMSTLGIALMRDFPEDYKLFATKSFTFRGRTINGHNNLMYRYKGMDGIKTGYTNASGYNLVSAVEDDGRRVIGVVMGGRSAASRDKVMEKLITANIRKASTGNKLLVSRSTGVQMDIARLDGAVPVPAPRASAVAALESMAGTSAAAASTVTAYAAGSLSDASQPLAVPAPRAMVGANEAPRQASSQARTQSMTGKDRKWQIQIAAATSAQAAMDMLSDARSKIGQPLQGLDTYTEMVTRNGTTFYRARFTGFVTKDEARTACDMLVQNRYDCVLMPARG
jgi:D-alanyl-D-alanine carboxypeptidase (penicillin-binding protein 5/6)